MRTISDRIQKKDRYRLRVSTTSATACVECPVLEIFQSRHPTTQSNCQRGNTISRKTLLRTTITSTTSDDRTKDSRDLIRLKAPGNVPISDLRRDTSRKSNLKMRRRNARKELLLHQRQVNNCFFVQAPN